MSGEAGQPSSAALMSMAARVTETKAQGAAGASSEAKKDDDNASGLSGLEGSLDKLSMDTNARTTEEKEVDTEGYGGARPKHQVPYAPSCVVTGATLASMYGSSLSSSGERSRGERSCEQRRGPELRQALGVEPHAAQASASLAASGKSEKKDVRTKDGRIEDGWADKHDLESADNNGRGVSDPIIPGSRSATEVRQRSGGAAHGSCYSTLSSASSSSAASSSSSQHPTGPAAAAAAMGDLNLTENVRGPLLVRELSESVLQKLEIYLGPDRNALKKNWRNLGSRVGIENAYLEYLAEDTQKKVRNMLLQCHQFEKYTVDKLRQDLHEMDRLDVLPFLTQ